MVPPEQRPRSSFVRAQVVPPSASKARFWRVRHKWLLRPGGLAFPSALPCPSRLRPGPPFWSGAPPLRKLELKCLPGRPPGEGRQ